MKLVMSKYLTFEMYSVYKHTGAHICMHAHTHTHTHMHACTHTHTHTPQYSSTSTEVMSKCLFATSGMAVLSVKMLITHNPSLCPSNKAWHRDLFWGMVCKI